MEGVADSALELVGNTPLVRLRKVVETGYAEVLGKMESLNPGGQREGPNSNGYGGGCGGQRRPTPWLHYS